jgi:hypothetical protein
MSYTVTTRCPFDRTTARALHAPHVSPPKEPDAGPHGQHGAGITRLGDLYWRPPTYPRTQLQDQKADKTNALASTFSIEAGLGGSGLQLGFQVGPRPFLDLFQAFASLAAIFRVSQAPEAVLWSRLIAGVC